MAGLGARLFPAFSKLTSAQVNGYLMDQSIMRFASVAARDAAFGGAGEPTLAEGMTCYLDDLNVLQSYNGTAWVSVAASSTVADVSSALIYVTSQTVGTAVSSVTVSNCFSSLYDNYFITMSNGAVISNYGTYLRFSLAGVTTNLWYGAGYYMQNATTITGFNNAGTAYGYAGIGETGSYGFKIDIQSPFLSKQKDFMVQYIGGGTSTYSGIYNAHCNSTASCASFTITPEAGTMTGGVISVYGYRKA